MNRAMLREVVLACLLLAAVVSVTVGVAMLSPAAGWIAGGVLGAAWSVVVFGISRPVRTVGDVL